MKKKNKKTNQEIEETAQDFPSLNISNFSDNTKFDDDQTQIFNIEDLREQHRIQLEKSFKKRRNTELNEYNEVKRPSDVYYMPDIHGDFKALRKSLFDLGLINNRSEWIGQDSVLVFSGDYIDRGKQSLNVLKFIDSLKRDAEHAGGKVELLLGNHEVAMIGGLLGDERLFYTWIAQGGFNVLIEIANRHGLTNERDWLLSLDNLSGHQKVANLKKHEQYLKQEGSIAWLSYSIFNPDGEFYKLFNNMKVFSQVDDILYVHAGVNQEWSSYLKDYGIDSLNEGWKQAIEESKKGDFSRFNLFNQVGSARGGQGVGGPFWSDFESELENMSEDEIQITVSNLKSMGVNAIVVGHTIMDSPVISQKFAKYGIKLIASDVGMSSYYTKGDPGKGGVKITQRGDIYAQSEQGVHNLHKALKIKVGDYVQVHRQGGWEIDWQIISIEGKEVILARQVGPTVKRIKINLDYLNKMNPRGGRSEK